MSKSSEYWKKRQLQVKANALIKADEYEAQAMRRLSNVFKSIEEEIERFSKLYAEEDGSISPQKANKLLKGSELRTWNNTLDEWERKARAGGYDKELNLEYYRSRVSRLEVLHAQTMQIMADYTNVEQKRLGVLLGGVYENTYNRTVYHTQGQRGGFTADFAHVNEGLLKNVLAQPWHSENFSQRLWRNNTQKLPETLLKTLSRGVSLGHSYDQMTRDARVTMKNFTRYEVHRLITTEAAHMSEQATLEAYEESGIERYEFMSALENKTCEVCGGLDSKVFNTQDEEVGVNYPPMHPNCRCTTAPWFEELSEFETDRWARDPETGKSTKVDDLSFSEWKKQFVTNPKIQQEALEQQVLRNKAQDLIKSGEWGADINAEKQAPHMQSTQGPNKSYFYDHVDTQLLLDKYSGTGILKERRDGSLNQRETVILDRNIGVIVDPDTGKEIGSANAMKIHHSKKRTHIVPTRLEGK